MATDPNSFRNEPYAQMAPEQCLEFVEFLQQVRESHRISVAQQLHDVIGAALVSTAMDLDFLNHAIGPQGKPESAPKHLSRAKEALRAAIVTNRRMLEDLRPSLLDNVGLYAACRWLFKRTCDRRNVTHAVWLPAEELPLTSQALTGIYRTVEGFLQATVSEPALQSVNLHASNDSDMLTLRIGHQHTACEVTPFGESHPLVLREIAERVRVLEGAWCVTQDECGSTATVSIPLDSHLEASAGQRAESKGLQTRKGA